MTQYPLHKVLEVMCHGGARGIVDDGRAGCESVVNVIAMANDERQKPRSKLLVETAPHFLVQGTEESNLLIRKYGATG